MIALALLLPLAQDPVTLTVPVSVSHGPGQPAPEAWIDVYSGGELVLEARADAAGVGRLALPVDAWRGGGRLHLCARNAAGAVGLAGLDLRAAALGGPATVTLRPLVEAEVHVLPPRAGLPVALDFVSVDGSIVPGELLLGPVPEIRTDGRGVARLRVPREASFHARVTTPGGQTVDARGTSSEPARVELPSPVDPASLELVLTAGDPAAVARRRLRVAVRGQSARRGAREIVLVTDERGRATLDPCPPGDVAVTLLVAPGDPPFLPEDSLRAPDRMSLSTGFSVREVGGELQVRLVRVGRGTGSVRAPGGLEPIAGARLRVGHVGAEEEIVTDDAGGFTFLDARLDAAGKSAPWLTVLDAPGPWRTPGSYPWPGAAGRLTAPPAGRPFDVELGRQRPATGTVVDENGAPVPRAWVSARWRREPGGQSAWGGVTDAQGRFVVPDVPADELELSVEARGFAARELTGPARPAPVVELRRERLGVLDVALVDPAGAPLAGVHLRLLDGSSHAGRELWRGATDDDGRARIAGGDVDGRYRVRWDGAALLSEERADVRLDGGERVFTARPLGTLRGRVVDSRGRPIAGARVRHPGAEIATATSADDGSFALEGADVFRALVTVRADGYRTGGAVAPAGAPVVVALVLPDEEVPAAAPPRDLLEPEARRALARRLLESWTAVDEDPFAAMRRVESWAAVDPAHARALLAGFDWPDAQVEARLFALVDPGKDVDPRFELWRRVRSGDAAGACRAAAAIEGAPRRLAHVTRAWWTARAAGRAAVCRDLQDLAAELVPTLEDAVAREREEVRAGTARRSPRGLGANEEAVRSWLECLSFEDAGAAERLVRGWRDMYFDRPRAPREEGLPADAAELRAAMERDGNLRPFPLLRRGIEEDAWPREELLALVDVAIRDPHREYDLPEGLALTRFLSPRDPGLARELLWRVLDRHPPFEASARALGRSYHGARLALAAAATDPAVGRTLFAAEAPVLERELAAPTREEGYDHYLFAGIDWARVFAPELLERCGDAVTGARHVELRRRAADALIAPVPRVLETAAPILDPVPPRTLQRVPSTRWLRHGGDPR